MRRILNKKTEIARVFPRRMNCHYFFGYYGISPWSQDERYLLGMRVNFINRHPTIEDKADILLKDNENNEIEKIGETNTWCWQQGCMLQWLGPDFNSNIIYNDMKEGRFVSVIKNIKSGKEKIIDFPVYAISSDGKTALTLNFSRLNETRKGYGYTRAKAKKHQKKYPDNDGIYLIDLKKNKAKLIVSLLDLYNFETVPSMKRGIHWVDHISISPDGKRACFFHRWYINKELFHTRLFTIDLNGKDIFMFPDSGFYSHISWKNNKELFGFCSLSRKLNKIRGYSNKSYLIKLFSLYRKIIPRSIRKQLLPTGYFILKDKTEEYVKINICKEDGHGSWFKDKYIITDTYPDNKHFQKLVFYNPTTNKKILVGKFYAIPDIRYIGQKNKSLFEKSGIRCDLHPRWDRKGEKICIDSVCEGERNMYVIHIKELL